MGSELKKQVGRKRRKARVRKSLATTSAPFRLNVFRSNRHIYAQLVDDLAGKTVVSASTLTKGLKDQAGKVNKTEAAKLVGASLGKAAREKGIERVVFDRSGNLFHGRVKALAEGAREAGLKF